MNIRSRQTTVTFRKPFRLSAIDHMQPAGTYRVVVDEEEIPATSFLAYRQVFAVSPGELASALEADLSAY